MGSLNQQASANKHRPRVFVRVVNPFDKKSSLNWDRDLSICHAIRHAVFDNVQEEVDRARKQFREGQNEGAKNGEPKIDEAGEAITANPKMTNTATPTPATTSTAPAPSVEDGKDPNAVQLIAFVLRAEMERIALEGIAEARQKDDRTESDEKGDESDRKESDKDQDESDKKHDRLPSLDLNKHLFEKLGDFNFAHDEKKVINIGTLRMFREEGNKFWAEWQEIEGQKRKGTEKEEEEEEEKEEEKPTTAEVKLKDVKSKEQSNTDAESDTESTKDDSTEIAKDVGIAKDGEAADIAKGSESAGAEESKKLKPENPQKVNPDPEAPAIFGCVSQVAVDPESSSIFGCVSQVAVLSEYRRFGVGHALMGVAEKFAWDDFRDEQQHLRLRRKHENVKRLSRREENRGENTSGTGEKDVKEDEEDDEQKEDFNEEDFNSFATAPSGSEDGLCSRDVADLKKSEDCLQPGNRTCTGIHCSAALWAIPFYKRLGYTAEGPVMWHGDVGVQRMVKRF